MKPILARLNNRLFQTTALRVAAGVCCLMVQCVQAGESTKVGVVSHINVLSDKVEDVSSPEAWKKTYIKEGMSDEQKAIAIWKTMVKYRHQTEPPNEFFSAGNVHDPLKTIHVYGYGMCCCASADVEGLARYIGLPARGRIITQHSVPEIWYDHSWHVVDTSLMSYFRNNKGQLASVDDIKQSILDFYNEHPEMKGAKDAQLKEFSKNGGWEKGPAVLATCETYDSDGINSAGWHGWWSNMSEYRYKPSANKIVVPPDTQGAYNIFDYGAIMGYQLNVQLRPGEKITRNWFNRGLHVNMNDGDKGPQELLDNKPRKTKGGSVQRPVILKLQEQLGDKAPGRIGNGTHEYNVPLADGVFRSGALAAENLASKSEGAPCGVVVKDAAKPGVLIVRMPSSYVYLGGDADAKTIVGPGGSIIVSFSDNHGLDWKPLARIEQSGDAKIDLKDNFRRYDYRLKFELNGNGTGLDALKISNNIQQSQAPLPLLLEGSNQIRFNAGPQEGTITYEGSLEPEKSKGKQVSYLDYHPVVQGLQTANLRGNGTAIFNLETPGEMTRIRLASHYRCRDLAGRDYYDEDVSFDEGKSWQKVTRLDKAQPGRSTYATFDQVPASAKKAQLRLAGKENNTTAMFDLRISADYREPSGGFSPVKVTFVWTEGSVEKTDSHIVQTPAESWSIQCGPNTVSKSYIVELAKE